MNKKKLTQVLVAAGIILLIVVTLSTATFIIIQPGERGVIFRPWTSGLDKDNIFVEGVHIVAPWNTMEVYDVKEHAVEFSNEASDSEASTFGTLDVLDKNGLTIEVEITVRFFPIYKQIGYIHEQFGRTYERKLVIPEVRSAVRKIMGKYTAEEIYSTKRQELEEQIVSETGAVLEKNNIKMTALLIRSIVIPQNLKNAIEAKQTKQQEALALDYDIQKAEKEKERKIKEAEGIAGYNTIINASMTDKVITYEGIRATLELAKSPNAKVIVIGGGDNGLPIILNNN